MSHADRSVAVTGAGGYLGGRVVAHLGGRARALVRAPAPWLPAEQQVTCDLLGPALPLSEAIEGASTVIHLAGHNEVVAGRDPDRALDQTVAMAERIARAAVDAGVRRVVYVSTVHVYGQRLVPGAVIDEDVTPVPTSPYAEARLRSEDCLRAHDEFETVVFRLTNAVGAPVDPRVDRWTLVASDLTRSAVLEGEMTLRSPGLQSRDFIALADASRITATAATPDDLAPGTYNLAAGHSVTIRALAGMVADRVEAACGDRPTLHAPPADGPDEIPYEVAVDRLATSGSKAEWSVADAIDEIVAHCIEHRDRLREQVTPT